MATGKAFKDVQLINGAGFEYAMADHGFEGQITILEKDLQNKKFFQRPKNYMIKYKLKLIKEVSQISL